ncbi:hypothetical protein, partial [Hoeflea sp.]|uniref:hypothetical protein n=1 Tax=Hoeflea sp. TaxID=1940281 RepID=UPI0025C31030
LLVWNFAVVPLPFSLLVEPLVALNRGVQMTAKNLISGVAVGIATLLVWNFAVVPLLSKGNTDAG